MWSLLAALLMAALPAFAADEDPVDVLIRLRRQVLAHGQRIPDYTCVETVVRDRFEAAAGGVPESCDDLLARRKQPNFPATLRLVATDRLRLDVAIAGGREIYSWAGAAKFEEGDIDELIPDGAMGTGPFAAMLLSAFQGRLPRFMFEGETTLDGRRAYEYSYSVTAEESRYRVKSKVNWIVTGYSAQLWVDPVTAELLRLSVRTGELPPETLLCETDTTLDYGLVQLGPGDYLLPRLARQRFIDVEGGEGENLLTYAACQEFRGESTLSFGERRAIAPAVRPAGAPATILPEGLEVEIELAEPVALERAAAGDRIVGKLSQPVRDRMKRILVPAAALAEGRLMRVELRHGARPETVVSLRWESIEIDGVKTAPALLPRRATRVATTGLQRRAEIELPPAPDARYGFYHFPGERPIMESGFRTQWITTGAFE